MAGYLTDVAKAKVLNNLVSATTYLGLAQSLNLDVQPNLATITEVNVGGYARIPVAWAAATSAAPVLLNSTDLQFGPVTTDMASATYAFLTDVATGNAISAPAGLTAGAAAGGGTLAAGTYYWVVTALNAQGETTASNEVTKTVTANQQVPLSWNAVTGATSYNIYRGTVSGSENVLVGNVTGTTFTAQGTAGTTATPPARTTAPAGNLFYIWELAEPVRALANKPIFVPKSGLIIE